METLLPNIIFNNSLTTEDDDNPLRLGSFSDDYLLEGIIPGDPTAIYLDSSEIDTYLQIVNADTGELIFEDDDTGQGTNSRLFFVPEADINYIVRATSFGENETGNYSLRYISSSSLGTAEDLAGNSPSTARNLGLLDQQAIVFNLLDDDNDLDYYRFEIDGSKIVSLALSGLLSDADLQLLNSNGEVLDSSREFETGNEFISFQVDPGIYYAQVFAETDNPTFYDLVITSVPEATQRISFETGGPQGEGFSSDAVISANGRFIAFESTPIEGFRFGDTQLFVYDRLAETISQITLSQDGEPGNEDSAELSISEDGQWIAFSSRASNLVAGDTLTEDVFVYDQSNQTIEKISTAFDGGLANGSSSNPAISPDGRFVAFDSSAANLVDGGDANGQRDIFVYDRQIDLIQRISLASDGGEANDGSAGASISRDGQYIAFVSDASNLVPGDTNNLPDVFLYNRETGTLKRISVATDGTEANGSSGSDLSTSISDDGRYIAFSSEVSNLVPSDTDEETDIFVFDNETESLEHISIADEVNGEFVFNNSPTISADGRFVAFEVIRSDLEFDGSTQEIYLYDRQEGSTERLSVASDGTPADGPLGNFNSYSPDLSGDGRYAVFDSDASNLVPNDDNDTTDVFLRDRGLISPPEALQPDLQVNNISFESQGIAGELSTITYTVTNQGNAETADFWEDALYLSTDNTFDLGDRLFGRAFRTTPLAPGESYTETITAPLPGAIPGSYSVILRSDARNFVIESNEINNVGASDELIEIDVDTLALGTPRTGTLNEEQSVYYRVEVGAGETLIFDFDGLSDNSANELYVSYGEMPTRQDYDFAFSQPLSPDQKIAVPSTQPGTYYVLAYGDNIPDDSTEFVIEAQTPDFSLFDPTYGQGGNVGELTLKINGAQFDRTVTATLEDGTGFELPAQSYFYVDKTQLFATFDLTQANPGLYNVVLASGAGDTSVVTGGLEVVAGGGGTDIPTLDVPERLARNRQLQFAVNWENTGINDIAAPLLNVGNTDPIGFAPNQPDQYTQSQLVFLGTSSDDGPAGILRPGQQASETLFGFSNIEPGQFTLFVDRLSEEAERPFDWESIRLKLLPEGLSETEFQPIFDQLAASVGPTWQDYLSMLRRNATLLPETVGDNRSVTQLVDMELQKVIAAQGTSLQGQVNASDLGIALGGHTVTATNQDTGESFISSTLNNGSYLFSQVTPGTYTLTIDGVLITSDNQVTVNPGQAVTGIELDLDAGAAIAGRIRESNTGVNIEGAAVLLIGEDGSTFRASTDKNGQYLIEGLPPGLYDLFVEAEGWAQQGLQVEATPTGTIRNLNLEPESIIQGTFNLSVNDPDAVALKILARSTDTADVVITSVGEFDGDTFTIGNLPTGNYELTISAEGFLTETLASIAVGSAETVTVPAITMIEAASVSGVLTSNFAEVPAAAITIGLFEGETQVAIAQTEVDGSFVFEDLAAGTYTLRAINLEQGFSTETTVDVIAGENSSNRSLEIQPGATLTGIVEDATTADLLPGIVVTAIASDGTVKNAITDSNGTYRFEQLGADTYAIAIPALGNTANQSITVDPAAVAGAPISLNLTAPTPTASISGQLRTAGGDLITGGAIRLLKEGQLVIGTLTDDTGRYAFRLLDSGTFELQAAADGASFTPIAAIDVGPGETRTQDFVAGESALTLVIADTGLPIAGATVLLLQTLASGDELVAGSAIVDSTGIITFEDLVPGNYAVEVVSENSGARLTTQLLASQNQNLPVTLEQYNTLTGTVTDSNGQPIELAEVILVSQVEPSRQIVGLTNAEGIYEVSQIPAGSYRIVTLAEGQETQIGDELSIQNSTSLDISLNNSTTVLQGQLVDTTENSIVLGSVTVEDSNGVTLGQANLSADGRFAIAGVAGNNLTLDVNVPGFQNLQVPNLTVNPNDTLDLSTLAAAPIGIGQLSGNYIAPIDNTTTAITALSAPLTSTSSMQSLSLSSSSTSLGLAASIPVSSRIPNWVETQFSDFRRRADELRLGDIPPLTNPDCEPLFRQTVSSVLKQQLAFQQIQSAEDQLDYWVPNVFNQFIRDSFILAGVVSTIYFFGVQVSAALGVSSAIAALTTFEYSTLFGGTTVFGLTTTQLVQLQSAASIVSIAKDIENLLIDLSKTFNNLRRGNSSSTLEDAKNIFNNAIDLLVKSASEGLKDGSIFGLSSSNSGLATGALGVLRDLQNIASGNIFEGTQGALEQVTFYRSQFENSIREYDRSIERAYGQLERYTACLREEKREEKEEPPTPETSPGGFGPLGPPDNSQNVDRPGSYDPNDILGPRGVGPENWVKPDTYNYTIRFENDPVLASAPAQKVLITQQLDSDLDFSTFRLGDFGFAEVFIDVPDNVATYETRIDLTATLGIVVDVEASIDTTTGEIFWEFVSLDPNTGELPDDPLIGFLAPNQASPEGEGFVKYSIEPAAAVTTGDVIDAEADIIFDFNPVIVTPPIFNTIDIGTPDSQVLPLPITTTTSAFEVTWAGTDDGSGIAAYDIFVSVNGGPFELWLDDTTDTSATYSGEFSNTYSFYSVAVDQVGYQEAIPTVADTSTTVVATFADLLAKSLDVTSDHVLSGRTSITYTLENQGLRDAVAFEVDIVYSNDDIIGNADDQVVDTLEISGLAAGDILTGTVEIQLPVADLNANALAEDPTGQGDGYVSSNVDYVGLVIDSTNAISESNEVNNLNQGQGIDKDDITYFPWDTDGSGQVTPSDAIFVINRLGQTTTTENALADFDGSGQITPSDAIAAINRLGYSINSQVIEVTV